MNVRMKDNITITATLSQTAAAAGLSAVSQQYRNSSVSLSKLQQI